MPCEVDGLGSMGKQGVGMDGGASHGQLKGKEKWALHGIGYTSFLGTLPHAHRCHCKGKF